MTIFYQQMALTLEVETYRTEMNSANDDILYFDQNLRSNVSFIPPSFD